MNTPAITLNSGRLMVSGDLDFSTIVPIWYDSLPLMQQCPELHFDFSQAIATKSASLALLFEWIKAARQQNKVIHFSNLSEKLMSVASVCGADRVLSALTR